MALIVLAAVASVDTVVALWLFAVLVAMGDEVKRLQNALAAAQRPAMPMRSADVIALRRGHGL